jgi:predicted nucleic acid-binding protein
VKRYLLDTGVLSAYLRGRPKIVAMVDPWVLHDEAATSILVYGEIIEYLHSSPDFVQRRDHLLETLIDVAPLPLDYAVMEQYAAIRRSIRPPQGPGLIGDVDTLIAATAQVHGLTVVTADSDYERVPNLLVQHVERAWLKAST